MVNKHARLLEIGPPQIWKPMKLPEEKKPKMAENTCAEVAGQNQWLGTVSGIQGYLGWPFQRPIRHLLKVSFSLRKHIWSRAKSRLARVTGQIGRTFGYSTFPTAMSRVINKDKKTVLGTGIATIHSRYQNSNPLLPWVENVAADQKDRGYNWERDWTLLRWLCARSKDWPFAIFTSPIIRLI